MDAALLRQRDRALAAVYTIDPAICAELPLVLVEARVALQQSRRRRPAQIGQAGVVERTVHVENLKSQLGLPLAHLAYTSQHQIVGERFDRRPVLAANALGHCVDDAERVLAAIAPREL